jgi:hypothetical protein
MMVRKTASDRKPLGGGKALRSERQIILNCGFRAELESTSINDDFPKNGMLSVFRVNILYAFQMILTPRINLS